MAMEKPRTVAKVRLRTIRQCRHGGNGSQMSCGAYRAGRPDFSLVSSAANRPGDACDDACAVRKRIGTQIQNPQHDPLTRMRRACQSRTSQPAEPGASRFPVSELAARRRVTSSTAAMKTSCPTSTPRLNINNASGMSPRGSPISESTREAEAVQKSERESHQPRPPRRDTRSSGACARDLAGEEKNAERDRGFDWRSRHVYDVKRRERKRDRVCDGKGSHCRDKHPQIAHDEDERENEQQMVVTQEDVFDAVRQVRPGDGERSAGRHDLQPGREG